MRAPIVITLAAALAAPLAGQVRDGARPSEISTAVIAGTVIAPNADGSDAPVRRAVVTVSGAGTPSTRSVVTDDNGRFVFRPLPAGRYTASASKAAYLSSEYGATRPGRPGVAIQLSRGQQMSISIRIARGAVIEGTVRDESGAAVSGAAVYAMDPRNPGTIGSFGPKGEIATTTDDRGVYRFYGLGPGSYVVGATFATAGEGEIARRSDAEMDALLSSPGRQIPGRPMALGTTPNDVTFVGYAPMYYPGVPVFAQASAVKVAAGEERLGVDFTVAPVSTGTIAGAISRSDGQPLGYVQISLVQDGPIRFSGDSHPVLAQQPGSDGQFRYTSVPPGRYTIIAKVDPTVTPPSSGRGMPRLAVPGATPVSAWYGVAEVETTGQGQTTTAITLNPGVTVTGRTLVDASSGRAPTDLTQLTIELSVPGGGYSTQFLDGTLTGSALLSTGRINPRADGSFALSYIGPGSYLFTVRQPPDMAKAFWLRSAMLNGRDLLDEPVVVGADPIAGVEVTITDRRNVLSGSLQTAGGAPAPDYYIVVAPADGRPWQARSRRFAFVRPTTTGTFLVPDLPAGDYFMAALTDFDPADFADDAFVAQFASQSLKVSIRNGEETVQEIRLAQ